MKARSLGERLAERRAALGLSQAELADEADIPLDSYKKYEADKIAPGALALSALARAAGVSADWLATGEGIKNPMAQITQARDAVARFVERRSSVPGDKVAELMQLAFEKEFDAEGLERERGRDYPVERDPNLQQTAALYQASQFVHIPLYDVRAAAGSGELVTTESPVEVLAFRDDWIRRVLHRRPEDLVLIFVEGDSMDPDLRTGDIILVDHTDKEPRSEGIYVLRKLDAVIVKRLQLLPGSVIKAISRNETYSPFNLTDEYAIVGRVVWQCRRV